MTIPFFQFIIEHYIIFFLAYGRAFRLIQFAQGLTNRRPGAPWKEVG